uniref:Uncharacterized protein n=1 Tax=Rhizophora mucronata TaxID=61149 RepID=A0A2P2J878_RHIMU
MCTSIPAVFIPHQNLPFRSEGSIFRECPHSQRRTSRPSIQPEDQRL